MVIIRFSYISLMWKESNFLLSTAIENLLVKFYN